MPNQLPRMTPLRLTLCALAGAGLGLIVSVCTVYTLDATNDDRCGRNATHWTDDPLRWLERCDPIGFYLEQNKE